MSASEAFLYKAVGLVDLSGQSTPYQVLDSDIQAGSTVLLTLQTERGTLSGVSITAVASGSFTVSFNTANDSIYSYLAIPPLYK